MDYSNLIQNITVSAIPLIFAITLHEAAHGYVARMLGDNTAWMMGRVTLNPAKHIDPIGTILMPLVLYFATAGAFMLGYAKPVPVRFDQLRNPKRDMIWVALAGPGANFVQAIFWGALYLVLKAIDVAEPFWYLVCTAGVKWNLVMFAFNLFPLPPLDGGRVLVGLLPMRPASFVARVEPYGFFIVIALVYLEVITKLWMYPVMTLAYELMNVLLTPLALLIH